MRVAIIATALVCLFAAISVQARANPPHVAAHNGLYGMDQLLNLMKYDTKTGAAAALGPQVLLALDAYNAAAIDPINGIYYIAVSNMTTGHATLVGLSLKSGAIVRQVDLSQYASGLYAMLGTELQYDPASKTLLVSAWDPTRTIYRILRVGRANDIGVLYTFPYGVSAIPDGPGTFDYSRGVLTLALYTSTLPTIQTAFFSVNIHTGQVVQNLTNIEYDVMTMNWDPMTNDIWILARNADLTVHLLVYNNGVISQAATIPGYLTVVGGVSALDLRHRALTAVMSPIASPLTNHLVSIDLATLKIKHDPLLTHLPINFVYY